MASGNDLRAHAIVPLALFEAIRALDHPAEDGLDEFHNEFTAKRLGMSRTVATQIRRYAELARAEKRVGAEEVGALLKLVGRRSDAGLVYADAGRRAGRMALDRASGTLRLLWRTLPFGRDRIGFALARRAAAGVFAVRLSRQSRAVVAGMEDTVAVRATPNGAACGFYGSAVAELLRAYTSFDGALLHTSCRARGDTECHWRAGPPPEE